MNVLVLGASENPARYSNMAVKKLVAYKHQVYAIGSKKGTIDKVIIENTLIYFKDIHTVTIYLSANNQAMYYNYIIQLKPKRLIFNPGAENFELMQLASQHQIICLEACTLVMLSSNTF